MFDINKLYNSEITEIADIAELIYDRDGTREGLSSDDVDTIADLLVKLEGVVLDMREKAYDDAIDEVEGKIDKAFDKGYDKGYDEGYDDGVAFKKRAEKF